MLQYSTNTVSLVDRLYDDAYALLIESRNYIACVLPMTRQDLAVEARLQTTYQSTRLTTRLLEIMSWLLAQRAVQRGEMSLRDARAQGFVISNDPTCQFQPAETSDILPQGLRILLEQSNALYNRLYRLDALTAKAAAKAAA
jgi:regulator of CtrA degradation